MTREEYRDVVQACKYDIRKAKAKLELNLSSDVKDNKEGLYICDKRKTRGNTGSLLNYTSHPVTEDLRKVSYQMPSLAQSLPE